MAASTKPQSDPERLREIVRRARGEGSSQTGSLGASPLLVRLAAKTGVRLSELVLRLKSDTVRRTKFPTIEIPQPDGSVKYTHDMQIHDGPQSR